MAPRREGPLFFVGCRVEVSTGAARDRGAAVAGNATLSSSAASILAKVHRDRWCREIDATWPQYGFATHKGYGTAAHLAALRTHGACEHHRRSFAPVAEVLAGARTESAA